jgi:hypothetical protein
MNLLKVYDAKFPLEARNHRIGKHVMAGYLPFSNPFEGVERSEGIAWLEFGTHPYLA